MSLERFRAAKAAEIAKLVQDEAAGLLEAPLAAPRPSFSAALRTAPHGRCSVIAEYKRASPSAGVINTSLTPEDAALLYAKGGASALSCLTEETYFQGRLEYLGRMATCGLPVLRKDFLFDRRQIAATAATAASALLLIVRMFNDPAELTNMVEQTLGLGLEPVVEIFDEQDLAMARAAGSQIIQVNTRDLDTLAVDPENARRLIAARRPEECWICASGIRTAENVSEMAGRGYDAVLVGTALMAVEHPDVALAELAGAHHGKEGGQ